MFQLAIRRIRKEKHMSQDDLAYKSGLSQNYISLLENNDSNCKNPTLEVIENIAKALEVCPLTLIECCHCSDTECKRNANSQNQKE